MAYILKWQKRDSAVTIISSSWWSDCVQYSPALYTVLLAALVNVSGGRAVRSVRWAVYTDCSWVELSDMTGLTKLKLVPALCWGPFRPSDYNSCLTTKTAKYKLDKYCIQCCVSSLSFTIQRLCFCFLIKEGKAAGRWSESFYTWAEMVKLTKPPQLPGAVMWCYFIIVRILSFGQTNNKRPNGPQPLFARLERLDCVSSLPACTLIHLLILLLPSYQISLAGRRWWLKESWEDMYRALLRLRILTPEVGN